MRKALVVAILLICSVAACGAATPAVQKLLPAKGEVAGFGILPDSLVYGKGVDVSKIYDGGYEEYTKNGVVDAAKQMYQRGKDFVEVTVHTMKSDKAALDFVKYWAKQRGVGAPITKGAPGFTVQKPNLMAYCAAGKYFVTVSAFYAPDKATKDAKAFAAAIKKKVL